MKTQKQFKVASIIVMSLGVIHIAVTPLVLSIYSALGKMELLSATYMHVATGVSIFFAGWLQYYLIYKEPSKTILNILNFSILFVITLGTGAVVTMWNNPFAYISLIVALYEFVLFIKLKNAER